MQSVYTDKDGSNMPLSVDDIGQIGKGLYINVWCGHSLKYPPMFGDSVAFKAYLENSCLYFVNGRLEFLRFDQPDGSGAKFGIYAENEEGNAVKLSDLGISSTEEFVLKMCATGYAKKEEDTGHED